MTSAAAPPFPTSVLGTIRSVLLCPHAWFTDLPPRSTASAVGIAVLVNLVAGPIIELEVGLMESGSNTKFLGAFVAAPIRTLIAIYVPSGIVYLLALIGHRPKPRYATVVRCLAYAQIPQIAGVIPVVGPLVALFWSIWLIAVALH